MVVKENSLSGSERLKYARKFGNHGSERKQSIWFPQIIIRIQ